MRFLEFLQIYEDVDASKQGRADFIKKTFLPKWENVDGLSFDEFIDAVANADPTKNGAYMPWIAKLIIKNPDVNKVEDLPRLKDDLIAFNTYKSKIENKDINSYRSFHDVYDVIAPLIDRPKSKEELKKEKNDAKTAKIKEEGIEDVYSGPEGWIKIPLTRAAAQIIGQNTRWCTSAKSGNQFDNYNKNDRLFVIYDKDTKERTQLHIQSGSYNDAKDKILGIKKIPEWAKKPLADWYKKNAKMMGLKHIFTLSGFSKENMAKGTEHEGVIDLMQKYGIV